jgi:hypothetical protein
MARKIEHEDSNILLVKAVFLVAQKLELLIEKVKTLRESLTDGFHKEEVN